MIYVISSTPKGVSLWTLSLFVLFYKLGDYEIWSHEHHWTWRCKTHTGINHVRDALSSLQFLNVRWERNFQKNDKKRVITSLLFFLVFLMSDLIQMDWILILAAALNLLQYVVLLKVDIKHSVSHRYIVRKRKLF